MTENSKAPFPGVTYVKAPERSSIGDNAPVEALVSEIIKNVRANGDAAVREVDRGLRVTRCSAHGHPLAFRRAARFCFIRDR